MRAFVISLARATERRSHMASQMACLGIPFEFFDGVDGHLLDDQEIGRVYDDARARTTSWGPLNRGEIGCALSHIGVWRKLIEEDIPYALVLEDDAVLDPAVVDVLEALPPLLGAADVVALVKTNDNTFFFHQAPLPRRRRLVYVNQPFYTAAGYVVTCGAAQRLVRHALPLTVPIDFWYHDTGFRGVVPIRAVHPPVAAQAIADHLPSQIGGREVHLLPKPAHDRRSLLRQALRKLRLKVKNRFLNWPAMR